jgi:hypothetical protein
MADGAANVADNLEPELTSKRDDEQATWLAASGTQPAATTARCAELF